MKFSDFIGQGNNAGGPIDVIKQVISKNLHSRLRTFWLTGPSGTGKSSLATLFAKATLCPNREEGSYEPCGECSVCTGEDHSNIHHYTITNASEARESVKELIDISFQYPVKITERADQLRRFIIIDEAELASAELLATLLDPLEHSPVTTTWIIVSMDPDKLERRDPIIKEAIESRCCWLGLNKLSQEDIALNLIKHYPDLDEEGALSIALFSEGNMRMAWNILTYLNTIEGIENITSEFVYKSYGGGADSQSRLAFWEALGEGNGIRVREIMMQWKPAEKVVAKLLEGDILNNLDRVDIGLQRLLSSLSRWYSSPHTYPLLSVFMQHLGVVIPFPGSKLKALPTKEEEVVIGEGADSFVEEAKRRATLKVVEQLNRVKKIGKAKEAKEELPAIFVVMTFEELLSKY